MTQFQPLAREEREKRRKYLEGTMGLSKKAIQKLERSSKNLCAIEKVDKRLRNLASLGFTSPRDLVEDNPTLLVRSEHRMQKRFHMVRTWLELIDPSVDIHDLFDRRPQLWSVGRRKFVTICMLLFTGCCKNATAGRLCNLITLNLEDILITFICYPGIDCKELHARARQRAFTRKLHHFPTGEHKRAFVAKKIMCLPTNVAALYLQKR